MTNQKLHQLGQLIIACEVYIVHGNKVLMHQRAKNKEKFPGYWIGPGGHVDEGEDVLTAAMREVREETGIDVREKEVKLKVLAFHHHIDRGEIWVEYLFRATIPTSQTIISSKEGLSKWIDIQDLLKMGTIFPPSKYYFDHILNDIKGIKYNYSQWKNAQLVQVMSEKIGT